MKNFDGYLKLKLGDTYVLLAGGSHKALSDFAPSSNVMTFSISSNYLAALLPKDMAIKAYNTYIEFWDGYDGAGWYNFLLGWLRAIYGVKVLSNNSWVDVALVGHTHDDLYSKLGHNHNNLYVTSVDITDNTTSHPDQLRYVKNGTSTYFTVPYATEALRPKYVNNWNVEYATNKINFMTCGGTAATGAPSGYTSGVSFMTSYVGFQLATYGGGSEPLYFRKILDNGNWWPWREIIHTGNWTSFINLTSLGAAPAHDHPYVPLSGNSTINGIITISPTNTSGWLKGLVLHDPGGGAFEASWIEWTSGSYSNGVRLLGAPDSKALYFWDTNAWQTVYHTGNLPAYPTKASWNYDDVYLKITKCSVSKSGETLSVKINDITQSLTNTWRGIQDNLTSTSTSDSLSANLGRILNNKFDNYLVKTTYDYHREFSAADTNYIELGCFSLYDSMVGIDITLTTTLSWMGRLIISSQNINSSGGGSYEVNVRGDNSLSLHTLISVVRSGTYFRVYLNASGWKKLFCHIWCVAAVASEIFLTVSSMPSGNITINNPSGTFGGNVYASNFYTTSDARKKQNIHKISDNIKQFEWKETGETSYGFVAQDLEVKHPELVNDDGNMKTVNYNAALSLVVAKLENRVKELEAKLGLETPPCI